MVRDRLRWPMDPSYLSTVFKVRDVVEVWCTGTHVKGAWLQARVRQVNLDGSIGRRYCLVRVLTQPLDPFHTPAVA